ncbi:hypothetical protein [Planctomyces sp. SH-PL62]|uniref:hypothetical protein n=1 Tax=Planctomyces sp. SH-PL62 TaxID=1636152 RepID=UPI00078B22F3|nr:hypothetical protein [Planctomyces sp. SH-PL62]AMV39889.1 hypothetical protein VT85_20825 [Planctomyces sp. SH-PL62]
MSPKSRNILIAAAGVATLLGALAFEVVATRPVRRAVRAYSELITIANRPDLSDEARIEAARPYFSSRYLASRPIRPAAGGGIVGLPRSISTNFQAWREGDAVWICPTNRVGLVHRLVEEDGRWRFDGLVGLLRGRNELVPVDETIEDATLDAGPITRP